VPYKVEFLASVWSEEIALKISQRLLMSLPSRLESGEPRVRIPYSNWYVFQYQYT
jgi:hypothetical protein